MSIVFEKDNIDPSRQKFSAVFVHQDYYLELLKLCNTYFNLHLLNPEQRELPLPQFTYMLIKKNQDRTDLSANIGLHSRITIDQLIYNKKFGLLVARVRLKKNWTSNPVPHIVLAKRTNVTNNLINLVLSGNFSHFEDNQITDIYDPVSIKGRIGVMLDSTIEDHYVESTEEDGIRVEKTTQMVQRPEVSISMEREPYKPERKKVDFTFSDLSIESETDGTYKNDTSGEGLGTYKGFPIKQGPRGGKYYFDDSGKKMYLGGSSSSNSAYNSKKAKTAPRVVYKVNMMSDKKE